MDLCLGNQIENIYGLRNLRIFILTNRLMAFLNKMTTLVIRIVQNKRFFDFFDTFDIT